MFKNTDKSFYLVRKILNVVYFVLMIACVIFGIILIALSNQTGYSGNMYGGAIIYTDFSYIISGILCIILGPVLCQLSWLVTDMFFNHMLDLKNIRNANYGLPAVELPAPLFMGRLKKQDEKENLNVYEKLREYKLLLDEKIISQEEFDEIKAKLIEKKSSKAKYQDDKISKVRELKTYLDEKVITEDEFNEEKSKILK